MQEEQKVPNCFLWKACGTRPTLDRAKESLFNILGNNLIDENFLDLFAGSGAIGLEALSRGARHCVFCDSSKDAINIIKKNIQKTHFEDKSKLYNLNFKEVLENKINETQDYIFLDPPYDSNYIIEAIELILQKNIINQNSVIIVETDNGKKIKEELANFKIDIFDERKYGRNEFLFIKKND